MAKTQAKAGYSAKDITVLEGLEPVRLRPGMYIGSTGIGGLHHLVYEVVANSVDEALAGRNDSVDVTIHPDNSVTVVDRGAGIPVDEVEGTGMSALEVVLTKLHAGGKFGGDGYKVSGGLHGVGVSVVNALSEWLVADRRAGRQGLPPGVRARRSARPDGRRLGRRARPAPRSRSCPTRPIFDETEFHAPTLVSRLRETAFLTKGLRIKFTDERVDGELGRVPLRGRHQGLRLATSTSRRTSRTSTSSTSRARPTRRRGRGRDAVEQLLPGVRLLVRQQHQHARGRLAPVRLQGRADAHAERLRAREGPAQGEGGQPRRRGRARGPRSSHLRQARRPAVRGPDEDEARQPVGQGPRRAGRQREARRVLRGEPDRRARR